MRPFLLRIKSVLQEDPASQHHFPFRYTPFRLLGELDQCNEISLTLRIPKNLHHDAAFNSIISMGDQIPCTIQSAFTRQEIKAYQDNDVFLCCAETTMSQDIFCPFLLFYILIISIGEK